ncbi:MAG: TRAP transporter large permease subunit [Stomatobaculum sp.]|nr:TRAP transporter large permease subunit [Stomatobaculum sp.]
MKLFAMVLFLLMYVLMIRFSSKRLYVVLTIAAIFLISGILPLSAVPGAINWNVLMMIGGTMILVDYFIDSCMPNRLADSILDKAKNVCMVTVFMSLFAGAVSAFMDNVATVLMIAPVGLAICRQLNISPVSMILSIAVSSNLQGAATLVGDTTSIMLGAFAHMDFMDFFWMKGRPGIFFAVELGALATVPIMLWLFRKDKAEVKGGKKTEVKEMISSVLLLLLVVTLIMASFFPEKPDVTNGVICLSYALLMMLLDYLRTKNPEHAKRALKNVDYETLLLLTGLFMVIEGVTQVGLIEDFADLIVKTGGDNVFLLYTIVVWGSVIVSAFVDNIPYVATMLPVLTSVTSILGIPPYLLYFGLLTGATLGGNLTPIGASANITAVGLLKKNGNEVSFADFMKIGVPFTLTAVMTGYVYLWIFWRG